MANAGNETTKIYGRGARLLGNIDTPRHRSRFRLSTMQFDMLIDTSTIDQPLILLVPFY